MSDNLFHKSAELGPKEVGQEVKTICGEMVEIKNIDDCLDTPFCMECHKETTLNYLMDTLMYNTEVNGSEYFMSGFIEPEIKVLQILFKKDSSEEGAAV